jgi:hypothetical protein
VLEGKGGLCGADGDGFFQVSSVSGGDACVSECGGDVCVSGWCRGLGGRVECDDEDEEKVRMGRDGAERVRRGAEKKSKKRKEKYRKKKMKMKKRTMKEEKKEKRCGEDRGRGGILPV